MSPAPPPAGHQLDLVYRPFDQTPDDLANIIRLVETELSEPYTVYTYRYFLHQWPSLAFLAFSPDNATEAVGIVVSKLETHRGKTMRGYLAMLSVHPDWRKRGIAKKLLHLSIEEMKRQGADEVVLETEADNEKSLGLYERMGFWREKRLWRFYLNGKDAFRLILPLKPPPSPPLPPKPYTPPPPVRVEDDFGSASFLSSETFVPSEERSTPLQLSHALQGLAQRVNEEDEDEKDGDVTILPPLARLCGARVAGGVGEAENENEPDDIELDEPLPLTSTISVDRMELLTPLEVEGEEDEDLEGLEVSEEDEGEWKAAGRTLSESLTEVIL